MRQRCFQQRAATSASQPHSWLLQLPFELLGAHVWPLLSSGDQARLRSTCRALRALADAQIQKNAAAEDGDAASGPLQLVCVPAWERVLDGSGTFHGAPCAVHAPLLKVLDIDQMNPRTTRPTRSSSRCTSPHANPSQDTLAAGTSLLRHAPRIKALRTIFVHGTLSKERRSYMLPGRVVPDLMQQLGAAGGTHLTHLHLSFCFPVACRPEVFMQIGAHFPQLQQLHVDFHCAAGSEEGWARGLRALPAGLTSLAFTGAWAEPVKLLGHAMQFCNLGSLRLDLKRMQRKFDAASLLPLAPQLTSLQVTGSKTEIDNMEQLLAACSAARRLRALALSMPQAGQSPLHQLLRHTQDLPLEHLGLCWSEDEQACGTEEVEALKSLTSLRSLSTNSHPVHKVLDDMPAGSLSHLTRLEVCAPDTHWWVPLLDLRHKVGPATKLVVSTTVDSHELDGEDWAAMDAAQKAQTGGVFQRVQDDSTARQAVAEQGLLLRDTHSLNACYSCGMSFGGSSAMRNIMGCMRGVIVTGALALSMTRLVNLDGSQATSRWCTGMISGFANITTLVLQLKCMLQTSLLRHSLPGLLRAGILPSLGRLLLVEPDSMALPELSSALQEVVGVMEGRGRGYCVELDVTHEGVGLRGVVAEVRARMQQPEGLRLVVL